MSSAFYYCESKALPKIDMSKCNYINSAFAYSKVEEIDEICFPPLSQLKSYSSIFARCDYLIDIKAITGTIDFGGLNFQHSTLLSKLSITNLFNALSADSTGLSITFSKTSVNNAFGIDVDDETTYPEGSEYYTLRHSKDNWTVNYI